MEHLAPIYGLIAATAVELGQPAPTDTIQTILLKDGRFVGHKLRYEGGFALLRADTNVVEFYSEERKLLKTVPLATGSEEAA
ncbi:MAG: hypothetical protein ABFC63_07330 [Thermoguttaceae bacterium]